MRVWPLVVLACVVVVIGMAVTTFAPPVTTGGVYPSSVPVIGDRFVVFDGTSGWRVKQGSYTESDIVTSSTLDGYVQTNENSELVFSDQMIRDDGFSNSPNDRHVNGSDDYVLYYLTHDGFAAWTIYGESGDGCRYYLADRDEAGANSDDMSVTYYMENANSLWTEVFYIDMDLTDAANGSEDSTIVLSVEAGGAKTNVITIAGRDAQVHGSLTGQNDTEEITAATKVLAEADCKGHVYINDGDAVDFTLPSAQNASCVGCTVTFINDRADGAQTITVDTGHASDIIYLYDGTALAAGNAADSSGAAADMGTFFCYETGKWALVGQVNTWADGGAD